MQLHQVIVGIFFYSILPCHTLLCTKDCSYTLNLTTPFYIPSQCSRTETAGKCLGSISFQYDRGVYVVNFNSEPSKSLFSIDNARFVFLQIISSDQSISYKINRGCKNKNECAKELIENAAREMLQRNYNSSIIMNELQSLIIGPSLTSTNNKLQCYDDRQNTHECRDSAEPGACVISDDLSKKKTSMFCDSKKIAGQTYVSIYQTMSGDPSFEVHCNRSLCNTQSTLQQAKEILFKHNITITLDGRLAGSQLIISLSLIGFMILFLCFNNFF